MSMKAPEIDPVETTTEPTKEDPMGSSVDMPKRKSTVIDPMSSSVDMPKRKSTVMDPSSDPFIALKIDPIKTAMGTTSEDPIESSVKTLENKPSVIDTLSDTHITHKKVKIPFSYGSTETAKEDPMGSSVDIPKRKSPLEKAKYSLSSSMKKKLYEINKRLSETPTVLWSMLHLEDEPLYASVSIRQYDGPLDEFIYSRMKRIENLPDEIFCTSDEYHLKRKSSMHANFYDKISHKHRYTDTRSTCVFLIGEPGCGKTAYCLNLLQKWCQREELQKFEYVFYVNLSVLQTTTQSVAYLISTSIYGDIYNERQVDNILRTEKCLVIMDGDNYFNESAHSKIKVYRELLINCNDCVFVFTMKIINFLNEESAFRLEYLSRNVPTRVIELLGLDEHGMTSLYTKICDIERSSGFRLKTEEGDYQFKIKKSTSEKETKQPEAVLDTDAKVSVDVQKKGAGSNTAKSDSEQELKERKDYDIEYFNFNKIKEMLKENLCDSYDSIMKIPMLGSVCVRSLVKGKDVPRNRTNLYLCLIDRLVERYDTSNEMGQRIKAEKSLESHALFQPYANIHRYVDTLCKLGKIAYDNKCTQAIELLNYEKLEGHLDETEKKFSLKSRLIVPVQTSSVDTCVRFVHKSIQDSLVAMYIVSEKEDVFESLCQRLTSEDVIIDLSHVIMMICGLNHHLCSHITKVIKDTVDKDITKLNHRNLLCRDTFIGEFYKVQLGWYTEYKTLTSTMREDAMNNFYLSDIYIDENTDTETISQTVTLLSDKNVVVTSMYVVKQSKENGLSDQVLNDFLAMNTSLESIFIDAERKKRSIEPLSFPILRNLELHHVHFQYNMSIDVVTKSLLSNLPMLQDLSLSDVNLNNVMLGLTPDEGRFPMLKEVRISKVDMGDQSIELSPHMTHIKNTWLNFVKMSQHGWMKFIMSLLNINHDLNVHINWSNIDDKAKEMVRTNENFNIDEDNSNCFSFQRVYTLK